MILFRKPILSLAIAFIYLTVLQASVVNSLYTFYVCAGSNAKPVVKEQTADTKNKYRWAIRAHTANVNNVKYSSTAVYEESVITFIGINDYSIISIDHHPLFYESYKSHSLSGRAPPVS